MNQWGNTEGPASRDPGRIRLEHGFLLLGTVALTAAASICAVDEYTAWDPSRGVYSILTGLFVLGGVSYVIRSGLRLLQREMVGEVKRLHEAIAELREERDAQRSSPQWAPPWGRVAGGNMYVSQASVETVPMQAPIAPDAAAALRRIGLRLLPGGDE